MASDAGQLGAACRSLPHLQASQKRPCAMRYIPAAAGQYANAPGERAAAWMVAKISLAGAACAQIGAML